MAANPVGVDQDVISLEDMIWKRQYAADQDEDFQAGALRVGEGVAETGREANTYAQLITSRRFIPGGRILAGAGSAHGNLLNCFVQDGSPFESGSTAGVLLLARKLALVTKVGGGNGVNLDPIAPKSKYEGPLGTVWLTIDKEHADYEKVRDGTYMDLVRGHYETLGYTNLRFTDASSAPEHPMVITVQDSIDGIWTSAAEMVNALLKGEDVLVNLSDLRPEGKPVKGSGGSSSGPGSFAVEIFENFARWASLGGAEYAGPVATLRYVYASTLRVVRQAGVRRGAGMATMSATHPDLVDFITAKDLEREAAEGDISTFNISVLAGDEFMRKSSERDGGRERGILGDIAKHAWQTGEPGVIFIDAINEHNPLAEIDGPIMATNPCVPADTWVMTSNGARQVRDLIGVNFDAVVDGKAYPVESKGFWSTGVKPVYRIDTKHGFEIRVTGNHRLKRVDSSTRYVQDTSWVPAEALLPGDRLVLQNHRAAPKWPGEGTFDDGWILGSLIGDGTFRTDREPELACLDFWGEEQEQMEALVARSVQPNAEPTDRYWVGRGVGVRTRVTSTAVSRLAQRFDIHSRSKTITARVEQGSYEFYRGFLRGLFDADGSVQGTQTKGVSVRLAQSDLVVIQGAQRMLARLGILSGIYRERRPAKQSLLPDGNGESRSYHVRAQHELVISRDNLQEFASIVGFANKDKHAKLQHLLERYNREPNRERFTDEIVAIIQEGEEEVFDVTVRDVHAFDANGFTAHNCGEIPLYPGEPCDLGAINLAAHVIDGRVDSAMLTKTARQAVRFLDDVLTAEKAPLPEIHDAIQDKRRIGLGVMGLADMLIQLGVSYDSDDGRATVRRVIDTMREAALAESADLALERGVPEGVKRAGLDRRNIAVFTVAPTGTTSMLAGVSGGVEPVFAATYTRRIGTEYVKVVHPLLEDILNSLEPAGKFVGSDGNWNHAAILEELDEHHGSLQSLLEDLPADSRLSAFVIAHDVAPRDHVLMQATVQRAFDWASESDWRNGNRKGRTLAGNSISKTCNLPNTAVVSDVLEAYELAWQEGCKGITVYRDGSRDLQVLTSGKQEAAEEESVAEPAAAEQPAVPALVPAYERQQRMMGVTDKVNLVNSNGVRRGFFITVNSDAAGTPREVFIVGGKAGDAANGDSGALGRVVSIALQYGIPAEALVSTLRGISGGMFGTYHSRIVTSKADLIAVALETAVPGGDFPAAQLAPSAGTNPQAFTGEPCPHCGSEMRMAEGCATCTNPECGWSRC